MTKFVLTIFFLLLLFSSCLTSNNEKRGYEGDLVPLKDVTDSIGNYERAVALILSNLERINAERKINAETFKKTGKFNNDKLMDSLYGVFDNWKLRFAGFNIKTKGNDTTITFESSRGDYYMRTNHKNKDAGYTIFWHSLIYTSNHKKEFIEKDDEDDTPCAVIKIKDKYYYNIYSALEY